MDTDNAHPWTGTPGVGRIGKDVPGFPGMGLYEDPRPKESVPDPAFARAVGLTEAIWRQREDVPGSVGVELGWVFLELEDYGRLQAARPVSPDVRGQDLHELLAELEGQLGGLMAGSRDLATTLRYSRAREHVLDARRALADDGSGSSVGSAAGE